MKCEQIGRPAHTMNSCSPEVWQPARAAWRIRSVCPGSGGWAGAAKGLLTGTRLRRQKVETQLGQPVCWSFPLLLLLSPKGRAGAGSWEGSWLHIISKAKDAERQAILC